MIVLLKYGSTGKLFDRPLSVKGLTDADSIVPVNPIVTTSDDGTSFEYAEGFKRSIRVNLGIVEEKADRVFLATWFRSLNDKTITFSDLNPVRSLPDYTISAFQTSISMPYANGDRVIIRSTASIPTGLSGTTVYFVKGISGNYFQLSLTNGGATVTFSDDGSGLIYAQKIEEVELPVVVTNMDQFSNNWTDESQYTKAYILDLLEKNPRTTNPNSWS